MIVYLARDIPAFVLYCIYGESRSSLLRESTDSMIVLSLSLPVYQIRLDWLSLYCVDLVQPVELPR